MGEPQRKRVLTGRLVFGRELLGLDPKPGDLAMARLKVG